VEGEARDADLGSDVRGPPEGRVSDDGVGAVLPEQLLVDGLRQVHGVVHAPGPVRAQVRRRSRHSTPVASPTSGNG
jgi:hypothetical protein